MYHEVGLLCAFIASAGYLWAVVDPCWKKTSGDLNVQPYDICYGLWKSCTITSIGEWLCAPNLAETPLDLLVTERTHYCRATMIIGVILSSAGIFLGGFSAECCRAGNLVNVAKRKYRIITGWIFLISALLPAGGAAWTTHLIVQERYWYKFTDTPGLQFTISRAVYITYGAALLNLVACICFTLLSDNGCCNSVPKAPERLNSRHETGIVKKLRRNTSIEEYV